MDGARQEDRFGNHDTILIYHVCRIFSLYTSSLPPSLSYLHSSLPPSSIRSSLPLQVRDDYRMDVDEERGGIGGGALRIMQRQGMIPAYTGNLQGGEGVTEGAKVKTEDMIQ